MSRIDSASPPEANPQLRRRRPDEPQGPLEFVRDSVLMAWRWLTRMRTALYLLGVLALLTLIATVVPQEPNVPSTVRGWRSGAEGPGVVVSQVLDAIGAFDVYGSPLFLALLLLLFLSLTACLIPRIRAWVRLVRRSQPPLVRRVGGQDLASRLVTEVPPDEVHGRATELLRARRWRLRLHAGPDADGEAGDGVPAPAQVAAEKGLWTREGGSLLFHLSFYVLLAAIVFGQLLTFEGQRGVVEGEEGFSDTAVSYWTYRPGRWFGQDDHAGWRLDLEEFYVDWVRDPLAPGAGQPTTFASDVTITPLGGEPFQARIEGNHPLVVDGMKIHQLDWGYAPRVVVEVDGQVVHDAFLNATVTDAGFFRSAVKAPAAEPDVGLELFFYPYAPPGEDGPVLTGAPWAEEPGLLLSQWRGDLRLGATQQTINELDTGQLSLEGGAFLRVGESIELEGVTIRFPEVRRWVGFQVSHRPQIPWLLTGAGLLLAGLVPALYAFRRRLWVQAVRDPRDGRTLVTVFGRSFQRPEAFEVEHARIVDELATRIGGSAPDDAADEPEPMTPAGEPTEVVTR